MHPVDPRNYCSRRPGERGERTTFNVTQSAAPAAPRPLVCIRLRQEVSCLMRLACQDFPASLQGGWFQFRFTVSSAFSPSFQSIPGFRIDGVSMYAKHTAVFSTFFLLLSPEELSIVQREPLQINTGVNENPVPRPGRNTQTTRRFYSPAAAAPIRYAQNTAVSHSPLSSARMLSHSRKSGQQGFVAAYPSSCQR